MKRHIVFDGQVLQTPAFHRGMGKYSIEFVNKLASQNAKNNRWDTITLILSSELEKQSSISSDQIKKCLDSGIKIVSLPLKRNEHSPAAIVHSNRSQLDGYIEKQFGSIEVDYMILSPMQGELCSVFPSLPTVRNLALCYDLIPLMFWKIYLKNPLTIDEYLTKLKELFRADLYVCISKTCANDLSLYLGVDERRIVNINGGPIDHSDTTKAFPVDKPFILMPTGNDLRKNNRNAILAFREFNKRHDNKYKLVITSFFEKHEISDYTTLCPEVAFTGNVSGEELSYLYEHCTALLFVSHYEGLGLPILEAMKVAKPVACSDISVFREITLKSIEMCDQNSVSAIARTLDIVTSPDYQVDTKQYKKILAEYGWDRTVELFVHGVKSYALPQFNKTEKPYLVVYGADPSESRDEFAMLMQYMHADLSRHFNVRYHIQAQSDDAYQSRMNYLPYVSEHHKSTADVDRLYFIGDRVQYATSIMDALVYPGVVALTTGNIQGLWDDMQARNHIHKSRHEAEVLVAKKIDEPSMLASLVAAGNKFVVFDDSTYETIIRISKKIGVDAKVSFFGEPVPSLPYPEILPVKHNILCIRGEGEQEPLTRRVRNRDDFKYFDMISRCARYRDDESTTPRFSQSIAKALGCEVILAGAPYKDASAPTTLRKCVEALVKVI